MSGLKATEQDRLYLSGAIHRMGERTGAAAERILDDLDTLLAENARLRAVAEAARQFVPRCQETRFDEDSEHSHECGKLATHMDRMNGRDTGFLCAEHAEASLRSATKAASKGHTRAVELDAPRPLKSDQRIDDLRKALAALEAP